MNSKRHTAWIAAGALWVLVPACSQPEAVTLKDPPPAPKTGDAIPVGPLSGKLLGEPFTVRAARYYVDQRPGYEKIDLKLYGMEAKTPCEVLTPKKPASVWLRRKGPERIAAHQASIDLQKGGKWEVHYQIHKDGKWVGGGDANALLVITGVDPDLKVHGELSACFRDETGSCVAGRFTASYCRISIDSPVRGTEAMERRPEKPIAPPSATPPPSASAAPGREPKL